MKTIGNYNEILGVKEVKEILRIGQRQTYALVKTKEFEKIRINEGNHFSKTNFLKWLEGKL